MKTLVLNALFIFLALINTGALNARSVGSTPPHAFKLEGDVEFTHDPSIIQDGNTWYLFSTANGPDRKGELPIRCSKDLEQWSHCGYVFDSVPDWIKKESPNTKELWAPDISYFDGKYHLYYAFSVFGKNT